MSEYIEKQKIEKFIEDGLNNSDKNKAFGHDAIEIMTEIHYMPSEDVAPVIHAKWVKRSFVSSDVFCSECRTLEKFGDSNYKSRYCPHCGAKMDLTDD